MASRDIKDCDPLLQEFWEKLRPWYSNKYPGRELFLSCTYRSPAEQAALYESGRTRPGPILTHMNGVDKFSRHNHKPALAFDVAVRIPGRDGMVTVWANGYFEGLGAALDDLGYRDKVSWGGDYKVWKDYPHFEKI
jgi:peptidoglycan L-alanyl-D-glutamate endopeptidase CwlK